MSPIQSDIFEPVTGKGWNCFAVIGDAGTGTQSQFKIARQMYKAYETSAFRSVLVLGDNVYQYGDPSLFYELIYEPYAPLFRAGVRFYPVLGNHDIRGGYREDQLRYWGVPAYYKFQINDADFFAIDTTLYLPGSYHTYLDNKEWALEQGEIQINWLKQSLKNSKAKFKIVYGHYPLFTSGLHAKETYEIERMQQVLEPILVENKVDIYMSGHDHQYERTAPINGVRHFVIGSSGGAKGICGDNPPYPRETCIAKEMFALFEITPDDVDFKAISKTGKVLDQVTIPY